VSIKMVILTKSKFMNGEQCARLLWFANKKQLPELTLSDKHKFAQGHDFEVYVKKLYPEGIELGELEFKENIEATKKAIAEKKTIFEAGIQVDDFFIRADLLEPEGDGWNLCEIKSSTKVKPEHFPDLAYQKFVCEKAGLKIHKCFVIFLNKEYIKDGDVDSKQLVGKEEVTEKVNLIDNVEKHAEKYLKIIQEEKPAEIMESISKHCNKPHECALKRDCWGTLPKYNVLQLTNWRVYWKLFDEGITDINDIEDGFKLVDKDEIIKEAVEENKTKISIEHIKHFMKSLQWPLYHFDFETFDTAVPMFDKSRPYQKMPFQYSLHIQHKDGKLEHHEFLAEGDDPRLALLESLKPIIGTKGDVIVYNQSFENNVFKKLAEDFPEHNDWIQNVLDRIKDLATPFKTFHYYNPEQKGSYSIKKVLPAITGKGYSELEINNGGDASMLYFYSHIKDEVKNKEEIRKNLLKYCGLDTEGMVWIINELEKLVENG
jgi:hypothetical protein